MRKRLIGFALVISLASPAGVDAQANNAVVSFDSIVERVGQVALRAAPHDPIGRIGDIEFWRGMLIVADELGPNVKVFSPASGALLKTVGRAGDGPGEYRRPFAIAASRRTVTVLDGNPMRLRMYDTTFALVGGAAIRGVDAGGLEVIDDARLVIPARLYDRTNEMGVHIFDPKGNVLGSFFRKPQPSHSGEAGSFQTHFATLMAGHIIVSVRLNSNEVFFRDILSGREWTGRAARQFYQPPDVKSAPPPGLVNRQMIDDWIDKQLWAVRVIAVDTSRFVVKFMVRKNSDPAFYYSLMDRHGKEFVTFGPTDVDVFAVHEGTLLAATPLPEGGATLARYRFRRGSRASH